MDRLKRGLSRGAALLAAALLMTAVAAVGAQAQTIDPDHTQIIGTATSPTLDIEGTTIQCDTGTAVGQTGADLDYVNLELDFRGNCNIGGLGVIVRCSEASDDDEEDANKNPFGTARLQATDATSNLGIIAQLNEGFFCDFTVEEVCTVTVAEQDLPISGGADQANLLNEGGTVGDEAIDAVVDLVFTNDNPLCGPTPSETLSLTGLYDLGNTPVSFD